MDKRIKVGWVGDWAGHTTGFATVARNVLSRLPKDMFNVRQLAVGYDPVEQAKMIKDPEHRADVLARLAEAETSWEVDVPSVFDFKIDEILGKNPWGQDCLLAWAKHFQLDVIVYNGDPWMTAWLASSQRLNQDLGIPVIYYQPIDGVVGANKLPRIWFSSSKEKKAIAIDWAEFISRQDFTVVYGPWAYNLLWENFDVEQRERAEGRISYIQHGVDCDVFAPGPKQYNRTVLGVPQDAFVIGMAATNQGRKNWPGIIKAVAKFTETHPNTVFFPWTRFFSKMEGSWDIDTLIRQVFSEPTKQVIRHEPFQRGKYIDAAAMAIYYSLLDVHVLWHGGEGCGLPHLEAQACGRPALAVDYGGITDYFSDNWLRIRPGQFYTAAGNCIERCLGDDRQLLQKLDRLYHHPELGVRLGIKGRNYARQALNWDDAARDWEELLYKASRDDKKGRLECVSVKTVEAHNRKMLDVVPSVGPQLVSPGIEATGVIESDGLEGT